MICPVKVEAPDYFLGRRHIRAVDLHHEVVPDARRRFSEKVTCCQFGIWRHFSTSTFEQGASTAAVAAPDNPPLEEMLFSGDGL